MSPLEPTTARVRALDRALSLLADHELATSTFGVRIAASTWADPYLLLLTGLAIVGGPLHGGASEFVRTLLRDAVATTPEAAIGQALRDGEHVPGFGHSVYTGPDPRAPVLLDAIEQCKPPRELWHAAEGVLDVMARDGGPYPNIDFALGVLGEATRMVHGAGETIFAVARERGMDRARPRGVPAPPPLPHPRHLHPDAAVKHEVAVRLAGAALLLAAVVEEVDEHVVAEGVGRR